MLKTSLMGKQDTDGRPSREEQQPPDYSKTIDADKLLRHFADHAADYAHSHDENRQRWVDSHDMLTPFHEAKLWMLEDLGGRRAFQQSMITLQADGRFRNDNGTVDLRAFMNWLSERADEAHERSFGSYEDTRQADEAETAYTRMLSILRDDYGVGWPRMDDIGGNALEEDLP